MFLAMLASAVGTHSAVAQGTDVMLMSQWVATVDETTQQIVLRWSPSPTLATMGYHICTGMPCIDYDTVFGRQDTVYICLDHSPLQRHTYRLHVFDSAYNASPLTPSFGNIVLQADIPQCSTTVSASWNPYVGMPSGAAEYRLMALVQPTDSVFRQLYTTTDSSALHHSFELPEEATVVRLKVQAAGEQGLLSQSNIVTVGRRTVDTAQALQVTSAVYDSMNAAVTLTLSVDTSFPYLLQRSDNGESWHDLVAFHPDSPQYTITDDAIGFADTLCCYRLEVRDACGMNARHSDPVCVVLPAVPLPFVATPNVLLPGDSRNGTFLPMVQGLKGDLYELSVYNRQGNLLFHTTDPNAGWTPPSSIPQGTYVYMLRCSMANNEIRQVTGTVTIIK